MNIYSPNIILEIRRRECRELREIRLVNGRREVEKTYLTTRCLDIDEYYLAKRGLTVLLGIEELQLDKGVKQVVESLKIE